MLPADKSLNVPVHNYNSAQKSPTFTICYRLESLNRLFKM